MPLQTDKLVMIGLGTRGDAPPNALQPPLDDGVHLRWTFRRDLGFPWYGFYLFRRRHQRGEPVCLSQAMRERLTGAIGSNEFATPVGTVDSDQPLVLTDDFPQAGRSEFDLAARSYLRFTVPAGQVAHFFDVSVGFRKQERLPDEGRCIDFRERRPAATANPVKEGDFRLTVLDDRGQPVSPARFRRVPTNTGPAVGLDCGFTTVIDLANPAALVELTLTHLDAKGGVQAFDAAGRLQDDASFSAADGVIEAIQLRGNDIARIVIYSAGGRVFLHEVCAGRRGGRSQGITITALYNGIPVASQFLPYQPGQVVSTIFEVDAMTAVSLSPGSAALVDVCWTPVGQGAGSGWERIEGFQYPMGLPVTHPDYPATGNAAVNLSNARTRALGRVRYGPAPPWSAGFTSLHTELLHLVQGGPAGTAMADKMNPPVVAVPSPADPGLAAPTMPGQRPLDLVLLGALHAAVAEILGLAWFDKSAPPGVPFDYLIVADYTGKGGLNGQKMLSYIQQDGFTDIEGYIVYNKMTAPATPLAPPAQPRAYALPGATLRTPGGGLRDGTNAAGLRWNLGKLPGSPPFPGGPGFLKPDVPVMYHVWAADLGNNAAPNPPAPFQPLTKNPVLVGEPHLPPGVTPQRPPDWPPFPLHYQEVGLGDGWWSFALSGIDLFGRHSLNSAAAPWFKWAPAPDPRPWYYTDPVGDIAIHPSAVRLLDKLPPPPPTAVEAYALDPEDPTVLKDAAYAAWFGALSAAEKASVIGLRVSWRWTAALARQAPDTKEFRVYFHPGRINNVSGRITAVTAAGNLESQVTTDIANATPAGSYVGCFLRIGADSYPVVGSDAVSPLRLRVRNLGTTEATGAVSVTNGSAVVTGAGSAWHAGLVGLSFQVGASPAVYELHSVESPTQLTLTALYAGVTAAGAAYVLFSKRPQPGSCSIAIPATYSEGTVSVSSGSATVSGSGTLWQTAFAGGWLRVEGWLTPYRVLAVVSTTELTLDRPYGGPSAAARVYTVSQPLFRDFSLPPAWDERWYVVGYNEHVTVTADTAGQPLRNYEVLLPAAGDVFRGGLPLVTSSANPLVYAHIGVSAADDKAHTPDDPKWAAGRWGGRAGNESPVGAPAMVFRVHRVPPPPPAPPPDSERVFATPADYHSHSFYTYRWAPSPNLRTHVFRAMDEAVFMADWAQRPRPALAAGQLQFFPDAAAEPRWDALKRTQVSTELNQLNGSPHTPAGAALAMAAYRALTNDSLRVLAGLPGNDKAFTQLTINALDPDDSANANRLGPDNPAGFAIDPGLRALLDTIDGRSTNRYFYRAAYVDGAHNRSGLGLSGPPIWLPNVVPPRAPVITKALGGDRKVTLFWASNREADLTEYQVFRTDVEGRSRDLRLMILVHTQAVAAGDPAARPAEVEWTDDPVPGLQNLYYRLAAVDDAGNVSEPSALVVARASDEAAPAVPALAVAWGAGAPPVDATASWTGVDETRLERRALESAIWDAIGDWRAPGVYNLTFPLDSSASWRFRLRARKYTGAVSAGPPVALNHV